MADLKSLADQASAHIAAVAKRGCTLAGGVALLATATGGFAYLIGLLVTTGAWRWTWAVVGLVVCGIPALAVLVAYRRLRTATRTVAETSLDLRSIAGDKQIRNALTDLSGLARNHQNGPPLVQLGRDLLGLKTVVMEHKDELVHLRQSVLAVTSFPGLMALGTVGSFGLLGISAVVVLAKVLF